MAEYAVPVVPEGILEVVNNSVDGGAAMLMLSWALLACPLLSATCTVMAKNPLAVGVPLITPVAEVSDKPAGRLPAVMLQVYGAMPPLAVNVALYACPAVPEGKLVVVITSGAGGFEGAAEVTAIVSCAVAVFADESATWTVKPKLPVALGVPLMAPVEALRANPVGKAPALSAHVYGPTPPVAASTCA